MLFSSCLDQKKKKKNKMNGVWSDIGACLDSNKKFWVHSLKLFLIFRSHSKTLEPKACSVSRFCFVFNIHLFTYFWLCRIFVAVCFFSRYACAGFSLQWLLSLQSMGCRHSGVSSGCTWRVGSFATRDQPVSPALAGCFLTTGPPGKSCL